ncbi:MAG: DUF1302 family protein [Porticoccaceae bacterium]
MIMSRNRIALFLSFLSLTLFPAVSWGIVDVTDNLELEGYVKAQNIMRASGLHDGELIQQRNTAQLEGKYYFLEDNKAFGRFSTGPIEEATFTFLARGVYDSVYDIRDSYEDTDDKGKSEYKVREAFVDFLMPPFTLRLGRQQVVWGETDNFRALDVINPLDLSWHWSRESWEDIRIPLWMARGIYDIGKIGPFEESFFELIVIPWDFQPNKVSTDPRHPWAFTGAGLAEIANSAIIGDELFDLDLTIRDIRPDRKLRNGQGGFRFKGILGDVGVSLNYFYGISATPGIKVRGDLTQLNLDTQTLSAVVDKVYPRTHVLGLTANYSEDRYTQSVFRLETTLTKGIPVSIAAGAPIGIDSDGDQYDTVRQSVVMLGIDRPTWIKLLNDQRTFFISTQFFWRRYLDHSSFYQGVSSVIPASIGGEVIADRFVSTNTNRLDRDEFVITFSASTSYGRAGRWKPQFVFAYDPRSTGAYNKLVLEYLWTKHIVFKAEQHFYWRESGSEQGPWSLGDLWGEAGNRRNETVFSATFQF